MAGKGQELISVICRDLVKPRDQQLLKVAAEMKIQKITNFMDWNSLTKKYNDYRKY